jgi:hypothetical protein
VEINIKQFKESCDKIYINLFVANKSDYLSRNGEDKIDHMPFMHARLVGMSKLSMRKYGTCNRAINNLKSKSIIKCFPWLFGKAT